MKLKDLIMESISVSLWKDVIEETEKQAEKEYGKIWKGTFDAKTINAGFCDIFADILKSKLPGAKIWYINTPDGSGTKYHAITEYRKKFYDAETPKGVNGFKEIPYVKRSEKLGYEPELSED